MSPPFIACTDKTCIGCGNVFSRRPRERVTAYEQRAACSRKCSRKSPGRPRASCPDKTCVGCGATFARKPGESTTTFYARSTCSRKCVKSADLATHREIADALGLTRSQVYTALSKVGRKIARMQAVA